MGEYPLGDLKKRVEQFMALELPGQPPVMHIGTFNLVSELWTEVRRLAAELETLSSVTS